jgi:predicted transposase YdaD
VTKEITAEYEDKMKQDKKAIALNLLKLGMDIKDVSQATGVSEDDLIN